MNVRKYKYHGILSGFTFDKINKDNFHFLIEKQIFDFQEYSIKNQGEDYFGLELETNDTYFKYGFHFNNMEFWLKEELCEEIYDFHEDHVEKSQQVFLYSICNSIDFEIALESNFQQKIVILDYYSKQYLKQIDCPDDFVRFRNKKSKFSKNNWFNYFVDGFNDWDRYPALESFLSGEYPFVFFDIITSWKNLYINCNVYDYCQKLKNELLNLKSEIDNSYNIASSGHMRDLNIFKSKHIGTDEINGNMVFKDDGEEIYIFITNKSLEDKKFDMDKAYFSDLYFFLCEIGKILKPRNSKAIEYGQYVCSRHSSISSFDKLIIPDNDYPKTKNYKRKQYFKGIYSHFLGTSE